MFEKQASSAFKKHAMGIIILGCLAMYFSCCLTTDALNVIQPAFVEKFGWSYSEISTPFTIGGYILIGLAFVYSTILMKNGTRIFGTVSFGSMALGTIIIGIAYGIGEGAYILFFAGALITKLAVIAVQAVTFQLCATWFRTTRGRILGIVTMAAPLNSATSVTLMTLGQNMMGLTAVFLIIGAILVIGTVLAYVYGITTPEEKGLTPDGIEKVQEESVQADQEKGPVLSAKEILIRPETWYLTIAFGILNGTIGAVMAFFITRMTMIEVPMTTALAILSISSVIGIPVSYIFGWLDDKFGTIKACRILGITYVVMLVCFFVAKADTMWLIAIAALGMASITGGTPNLHPSAIMYVFGTREYQNANRYIGIGISLISAYGVQLMSNILDRTGSLDMGYAAFAVLTAIATVCLFLTRKRYSED